MSEYDLVIRAGTVVDGTGGAPQRADVAVADGVVVEVGRVSGTGRRELDADGTIVSPGFVDVHTHYDGQVTWDERLHPSSWNGVTTAVTGNCGVGFAPVEAADHDRLIELMEGVEDIPGIALQEGLEWDWKSFPDYLDVLAGRSYDMDVAAQVPHAALRVFAMGDRASAYEKATSEEIDLMAELARQAVEAGAIGFSTSRLLNHKSATGEVTPTYDAGADELIAIARAIGLTGRGVLQVVSDFLHPDIDTEFGVLREMVRVSGRPLSFSLGQSSAHPLHHRQMLQRLTEANAAGLPMKGQVPARGIGLLLGLQNTLHPFMLNPVWQRLAGLPVAEQAARMSDPELRAEILAAQHSGPNLKMTNGSFISQFPQMYEMTDPPNYEPPLDSSVTARAARLGRTPEEVAYDALIASEGRGMLYLFIGGYGPTSFDATHEMLTHPHPIPGLSDGGAHVGSICDGSFPTTLLQHWVRDRDGARLDLPFVIQRQSRDTARAVGLTDRGELRPGFKADINVIDMDAIGVRLPEMHYDLPAGGKRLLQRVEGYKHTFVNGIETYHDGQATGELPGRLVRS
jgi:N-acyl-D-aspartate/D-glutamate deacylase